MLARLHRIKQLTSSTDNRMISYSWPATIDFFSNINIYDMAVSEKIYKKARRRHPVSLDIEHHTVQKLMLKGMQFNTMSLLTIRKDRGYMHPIAIFTAPNVDIDSLQDPYFLADQLYYMREDEIKNSIAGIILYPEEWESSRELDSTKRGGKTICYVLYNTKQHKFLTETGLTDSLMQAQKAFSKKAALKLRKEQKTKDDIEITMVNLNWKAEIIKND